jgi:hypothetical protein
VGTAATPALADYGPGAQFQVEISANNVGGVPGDGVWLWIELNRDGGGDYTGSDCIHSGPGGPNGADHQRGDVEWTDSGGKLTITGVALVDAQFPVIIVVPDRYGHYVLASDSVIQDFAPRPDRRDRAGAGRPVRTAHDRQRHNCRQRESPRRAGFVVSVPEVGCRTCPRLIEPACLRCRRRTHSWFGASKPTLATG